MTTNMNKINFSTLLASSVHDIKNILGSVLESIDYLDNQLDLNQQQQDEFIKMNSLLTNVNSELMQLLCIYKFENQQYKLLIIEHEVADFLDMQLAFLAPLTQNCELKVVCDSMLVWNFDEMLVSTAIRNAAMNSIKFAKQLITIEAKQVDNHLVFIIKDDGIGYPETMLGEMTDATSSVDFGSGSTGLGLYFAYTIARLHGDAGKLVLENNPGACFKLQLP